MIELTEEQQRELARSGWPPAVTNPKTGETFLLVHKELFERVRAILEEEDEIAAIREMYPLVSSVLDDRSKDASRDSGSTWPAPM